MSGRVRHMVIFMVIEFLTFSSGLSGQDSTKVPTLRQPDEIPENTLLYTENMLRNGLGVVVRPHLARDGKIVIFRENGIPATPEGTWIIESRDSDELNAMGAGWWFGGSFTELVIPTAQEVFNLAMTVNKAGIDFIVDFQPGYSGIERLLAGEIKKYNLMERIIWINVPAPVSEFLSRAFPGFTHGVFIQDSPGVVQKIVQLQAPCILIPVAGSPGITHDELREVRQSGKKVIAIVKSVPGNREYIASMAAELRNLGFDDVVADLPAQDFYPLLQAVKFDQNKEKRRLSIIKEGESVSDDEKSGKEKFERVGNMVKIPAGIFWMGSNSGEGYTNEGPYHPVFLDEFWMDMYEVAIGEYVSFLNAGNHDMYYNPLMRDDKACGIIRNSAGIYEVVPGREQYPVTYTSWVAADAYARWVGKRLPTEAEWEKAARGTVPGRQFSTAGYVSQSLANYAKRGKRDYWDFTSPVGVFPPNEYMMYDMCGNAWEWVQDFYHPNFYQADTMRNPVNDPKGEHSYKFRMIRGGSWADDNEKDSYLRVSARGPNYPIPENWAARVGIRCASSERPVAHEQRSSLAMMVDRLRESNPRLYNHISTDSLRHIILKKEYLLDIPYDSGIKSLAKAVAFSAILPGTGELYTGRLMIGAVFIGIEAALWYNAVVNHSKAQKIDVYFKDFAELHYNPQKYTQWLLDYRKSHNGAFPPNFNPDLTLNVPIRGKTSDYYIRIGKYNQFLPGWDDYRGNEGLMGSSQNRDYYQEIQAHRWKDKDYYGKRVTIYSISIAGNHLLSVVDTIWGIKRNTVYRSAGWSWDMEQKSIDGNPTDFLNIKYRW